MLLSYQLRKYFLFGHVRFQQHEKRIDFFRRLENEEDRTQITKRLNEIVTLGHSRSMQFHS